MVDRYLSALLFLGGVLIASPFGAINPLPTIHYSNSLESDVTQRRIHTRGWQRSRIGLFFSVEDSGIQGTDDAVMLGTSTEMVGGALHSSSSRGASKTELWLDLRGTAIAPRAALMHLSNDIWGDFHVKNRPRLVDRMILADGENNMGQTPMDEGGSPEILVAVVEATNEGDDMTRIFQARDLDTPQTREAPPFGKLMTVAGKTLGSKFNGLTDPLPAYECLSNGGWVVIDSSNIMDDGERTQAVSSLVDFLAAAGPTSFVLGAKSSSGDEDEPGRNTDGASSGGESGMGGIAVICKSKADILHFEALLQALHLRRRGTHVATTDSGILFEDGVDHKSDSSDSALSSPVSSETIKLALVLPFDALLWSTASFFFDEDILGV